MSSPPPPATSPEQGTSSRAREGAVVAGKGALFIGLAKAVFMVAGAAQRVLLGRILAPAEYGAFGLVNGVVSTVNNTMVQGTIQAISKFTAQADESAEPVKRAGLRMQALLGTAVGLIFLLAAPLFVRVLNVQDDYLRWFRLVAAIPFLYGFYAVYIGAANGLRRFRTQAGFDIGFSACKTVLLLAGAWLAIRVGGAEAGVTGAFAGFVLAALLILILAARLIRLPGAGGAAVPFRRLFPYMGGVMVYALLVNVALNYDMWWLRRFAGALADPRRADALVGNYEALRTIALLPYQALIVITFVIFPLVSRSVFEQDRQATAAYVSQTMRIGLLFAGAMGVVLGARPDALLGGLYAQGYHEGMLALPVLVAGQCGLAVLGVACAIINASGRPRAAVALVGTAVAIGSVLSVLWLPSSPPGPLLLRAQALAVAVGMLAGLGLALAYFRWRFAAGPPALTIGRVFGAVALAAFAARWLPVSGRMGALLALPLTGVVYLAVLFLTREFTAQDRQQLLRILRRR